eukprot:CAMPEP_0117648132 /NCGR_PEP_ID=MMETSP0804-20121206/227_1 /TAXON_ID=1074897 /ORGANISM="Tetraselmis astigmatica, Strain CCMP880" /LENGTH=472 /DNA_ID=CAMNT_0005453685 /DNA_START=616 /DNA_END=2034 /DNA_ORIENTATION=+
MLEVNARILDGPTLAYGAGKQLAVRGGAWNMTELKFLQSAMIRSFAVCAFIRPDDADGRGPGQGLDAFIGDFVQGMNKLGIRWDSVDSKKPLVKICRKPYPERMDASVEQDLRAAVQDIFKKTQALPSLIVVVLPMKDTAMYRAVKRAGDSILGIPTQCVVAPTAGITRPPNRRDQYIANVALKVNHKLSGVNTSLMRFPHIGARPFMLIGADVTHPGAGNTSSPSIAGIVGSLDPKAGRYATRIQMQAHREEIITKLDEAVASLLLDFYKVNKGLKPESIIFFRDGVAEGQFAHVLDQELPRLRKACRDVSGDDYQPTVTFVVVQKRHQTRLFPKPNEGDKKGNLIPGTVVDTGICHPHEYDFFLNSHEGIQGTVRPAHYHVLRDENNFSADDLHMLTHHLCYTFCRCTRSVSVCPPAYYAHLAAERGRVLCNSYAGSDSDIDSISSGRSGVPQPELEKIHANLVSGMFFV